MPQTPKITSATCPVSMRSISLTPGGTFLETIEKCVRAISWARLMPNCVLDFSEGIRMPELKLAGFGFVVKSLHLIIHVCIADLKNRQILFDLFHAEEMDS